VKPMNLMNWAAAALFVAYCSAGTIVVVTAPSVSTHPSDIRPGDVRPPDVASVVAPPMPTVLGTGTREHFPNDRRHRHSPAGKIHPHISRVLPAKAAG